MKTNLASASLITFFLATFVVADNQPPNIKQSDLDTTPIKAGQLRITITKSKAGPFGLGSGIENIQVRVENPTDQFVSFFPQRLSLLSRDYQQADVLAIQAGQIYWPAVERRLAPGATIKEHYALTNKANFPARLYYDEQLIAIIVN